jgi:hypothetical protein
MPVTRSEALFFVGGIVAGVAAAAALPLVKRQLDAIGEGKGEGGEGSGLEIGQKLAATVEQFMQNAPGMTEAGASGMAAGVKAAKRMAEAVRQAATEGVETIGKSNQQAA